MGAARQSHIASLKRFIGCAPDATHSERVAAIGEMTDRDWVAEHVLDGLECAERGDWAVATRVWGLARETLGRLHGACGTTVSDALIILQNSITDRIGGRS